MKRFTKTLSALLPVFALLAAGPGNAQTTETVDSSAAWIGYMNWYNTGGSFNGQGGYNGNYESGSVWGTGALTAFFDPTGKVSLTLEPCTNVWETTDTYWVTAGGQPNAIMDASMYVQNDTLAGQTIVFEGTCTSYTLSSQYTCYVFIKDLSPSYSLNSVTEVPVVGGQPFNISLATASGDNIQYGFETCGPDANPATSASLGKVVIAVNNLDPDLTPLAGQALVQGQTATFNVGISGTSPFTNQWSLANSSGTNVISNNGTFSGATTSNLTIANIQPSDAGTYTDVVTDPKGTNQVSAPLAVIPLSQAVTNYLVDPFFASGTFATTSVTGWSSFNGAAYQNEGGADSYYYLSDEPITVYDTAESTNELEVYDSGQYDGAYQDRPCLPGQVFSGGIWFLTPSADQIQGSGICFLEVQFRDVNGNILQDYESTPVTTNTPVDTWIEYPATNLNGASVAFMVSPPNTVDVRFQVTFETLDYQGGEVDADSAFLTERAPSVTSSLSGSNMQITFPTLYGPTYVVYSKSSLAGIWQVYTNVLGDGTVKTVTAAIAPGTAKFYVVNTAP